MKVTPEMIEVPEGLLSAVLGFADGWDRNDARRCFRVALAYLANNPQVPTLEQWREILEITKYNPSMDSTKANIAEWQRRMFLKPEPEIPEEVKAFLIDDTLEKRGVIPEAAFFQPSEYNRRILAAYRLGKEGK